MNPKQLACVVLMMIIGSVVYFGQIVHKKVAAMKQAADLAKQDAAGAEGAHQTAEILTAKAKVETEDLRRFLKTWTPFVDKAQTEQQIQNAIEFSLRDRSITLVFDRKSEIKPVRENKIMPRTILSTIVIEDEYAKVWNWMGDVEKRLPLARVNACRITGGATARQLKLDISLETPVLNLATEAPPAKPGDKKKT